MLMAGPATNMTTITMVGGMLGKRSLGIYIGSIVVCSLVMAYVTDMIYRVSGISAAASIGLTTGGPVWEWAEWTAALILGILILRTLWQDYVRPYVRAFLVRNQAAQKTPAHRCACDCCAEETEDQRSTGKAN